MSHKVLAGGLIILIALGADQYLRIDSFNRNWLWLNGGLPSDRSSLELNIVASNSHSFEFPDPAQNVWIQGVVRSNLGVPIEGAWVGIRHGSRDESLGSTATGRDGFFRMEVSEADEYVVTVTSPSASATLGVYPRRFMSQRKRILRQGAPELQVNFDLEPVGNIVLYCYDQSGILIRNKDWIGLLPYTTDEHGLIASSAYHAVHDDYSRARDWDYELALPNILIPLGTRRVINVLWEVSGFGKIILVADNGGSGYVIDTQAGVQILLMNYELAKTQARYLNDELRKCRNEGYLLSQNLITMSEAANSLLSKASSQVLDQQYCASLSDKALNQSLHASELLELEKAKQNIDCYRKRPVTVRLLDSAGNPIKDGRVRIRQTSTDFLFGAYVSGSVYRGSLDNPLLDLLSKARVNYLTLHLNWKATEPTPGSYDQKRFEGAKLLAERGFALKGHAIIWFSPDVLPDYVYKMDFQKLNQSVYTHVYDVVMSCKGFVHCWELNEMEVANDVKLTLPQMIEIARTAVRAIRKADPTARINISFTEPYGQHSKNRYSIANEKPYAYVPFEFIQELLRAGIDFDAIALHMYYGGAYFARDLSSISRVIDWYASFGKPIEIPEIETSSAVFEPGIGYWHDRPSERLQAEWITSLYTMLLGKRCVDRISWWSAKDTYAFISEGGIIDASNRPKEAYYALKNVIDSVWDEERGLLVCGGVKVREKD